MSERWLMVIVAVPLAALLAGMAVGTWVNSGPCTGWHQGDTVWRDVDGQRVPEQQWYCVEHGR